jgi:hypothetical protein
VGRNICRGYPNPNPNPNPNPDPNPNPNPDQVGRNICHGSDSVENAEKEIKLWFKDGEVIDWTSHSKDWVHEER